MRLAKKLELLGVDFTVFREPDIDDQVTAISFVSTPLTKKITSGLPLLLKTKTKIEKNEDERIYSDATKS